jgi:hypothetical protein
LLQGRLHEASAKLRSRLFRPKDKGNKDTLWYGGVPFVAPKFIGRLILLTKHLLWLDYWFWERTLIPPCHIFSLIIGAFITWRSNYTRPLHNQDAHIRLNVSNKTKKGTIHIVASKCRSPKERMELQSVDYAATHVFIISTNPNVIVKVA